MTSIVGPLNFPTYQVRYASKADLNEIAAMQAQFYPNDAVPLQRYKDWFSVNPEGLFVIEMTSPKKDLIGHFTLLAIKNDRMEAYKSGLIKETDILGCDLFDPQQKSKIKNIYVESIIIKKEHRRHAIPNLIRILKTTVLSFCDPAVAERVYAMAATTDGKRTLRGMGFNVVDCPAGQKRVDNHEMYETTFPEFMAALERQELNCEMRLLSRPQSR